RVETETSLVVYNSGGRAGSREDVAGARLAQDDPEFAVAVLELIVEQRNLNPALNFQWREINLAGLSNIVASGERVAVFCCEFHRGRARGITGSKHSQGNGRKRLGNPAQPTEPRRILCPGDRFRSGQSFSSKPENGCSHAIQV